MDRTKSENQFDLEISFLVGKNSLGRSLTVVSVHMALR